MFLLPLGMPPIDSIDLGTNTYLRNPRPDPPPRNILTSPNLLVPDQMDEPVDDQDMKSYYELLLNKLEFNNNAYVANILSQQSPPPSVSPPSPPNRLKLPPIYESHESEEYI
jgi:hypothetical protein